MLSDRLGRRKVLLGAAMLFVLSASLASLATTYTVANASLVAALNDVLIIVGPSKMGARAFSLALSQPD